MKTKLSFQEFANRFRYYEFFRCTLDGVRGTLYKVSGTLSDDDKSWLLGWRNVRLYITRAQYAPEVKHNAVFIADKIFRRR